MVASTMPPIADRRSEHEKGLQQDGTWVQTYLDGHSESEPKPSRPKALGVV